MLKHSHLEAIGEIKINNPWIEDVYSFLGFKLVHFQNLKHRLHMSTITPRHVWRFSRDRSSWRLIFQYGIAE